MSDLREILIEEYNKTLEEVIDPNSLVEMIEEAMEAIGTFSSTGYVLSEAEEKDPTDESTRSDDVTVIRRPVIKITELWGKTENGDREIMESLMRNIEGPTVEAKIQSVKAFVDQQAPPPGEGDIARIMSYLIFLDTFASIISDYGASVTGFLFEAFLAALFGGTSIQVDDPEDVGATGSLPIEDNQLFIQLQQARGKEDGEAAEQDFAIVPYSLKVLRKGGIVHGSYKNLVDFFLDPAPQRKSDSIVYLIVIKDADKGTKGWNGKLDFYEFTITRENFLNLIGAPKEIPLYGWVPKKASELRKTAFNVDPEKNIYPTSALAALRGMKKFKLADGSDITEPTRFSGDDELLVYMATGETQDVASAKLFSAEEYERIRGEFSSEADISRQVFAALKDTKGYGSKVVGGAQWSISPTVYRNLTNPDGSKSYKGTLDLDPELLKGKAEEYTQSLNGSIVAIFNALGDLSENINKYFIGAKDQNRKAVGLQAKQDADILKNEVNTVIKT